jgi:hypothetical protein
MEWWFAWYSILVRTMKIPYFIYIAAIQYNNMKVIAIPE